MQKIGIVKCNDKKIKYYDKYIKNEIVKLTKNNLRKITSAIVNTHITKMEYDNMSQCLRLVISLNIKIIYQSSEDNTLHVEDKNTFTVSYIPICKIVEGNSIDALLLKNKIKSNVYIENISTKEVSLDTLIVNFYMIISLNIEPSYCIAYNINNGLANNIYISFSDGKKLTQKTFTYDLNYTDLKWIPNSTSLLSMYSANDLTYFCICDCKNPNVITNKIVNVNKFVNKYNFIDSNRLLLDVVDEDMKKIYILNLKSGDLKYINTSFISNSCHKSVYNYYDNKIYFLSDINNRGCLYKMNLNSNPEVLFDHADVKDYKVSFDGLKTLLKVKKDTGHALFLLDNESNSIEPININSNFDDILKFDIYEDFDSNINILMLLSKDNLLYILNYNIMSFTSSNILNSNSVVDFSIDYNSKDLYICTMEENFYKVVKINKNNIDTILKIPSKIISIACKN